MKNLQTYERYFETDKEEELSNWQQRWDQLLADMEEESEPEGGPIADEYGRRMNDMEIEKEKILNKYKNKEVESTEDDDQLSDDEQNYLDSLLNHKQLMNIVGWIRAGRDKDFVTTRLKFYGIDDSELDKVMKLLYSQYWLGKSNKSVNTYAGTSFESIKNFEQYNEAKDNKVASSKEEWWKFIREDWNEYNRVAHNEDEMSLLDYAGDLGSGNGIYGWKLKLAEDNYGDDGSGYYTVPSSEKDSKSNKMDGISF